VDNSNVDKRCSQWVSWPKIPLRLLIGPHARLGWYTREGIAVRALHSGHQALLLVPKVSCPDRVKTG
jgi:hypothetical protein